MKINLLFREFRLISNDAPQWFKVMTPTKQERFNAKMKNEETLSIFSKFQKWITVTPNSQNRKRPLEKEKIKSMDKTSKIMPNWMQPKYSSSSVTKEGFVSLIFFKSIG